MPWLVLKNEDMHSLFVADRIHIVVVVVVVVVVFAMPFWGQAASPKMLCTPTQSRGKGSKDGAALHGPIVGKACGPLSRTRV
jgi:hypothetical protein